ncbi:MAG: 3-deoxy-D-manno-octulosonate 8-phosphate phosphatase (KDO 8-P phosphatase) [Flavobacteriales bacterium]|jgi:3-deoxy-D-manno-octulosonate 8-phosphate phosphatase (KDO 8-P phosphatase)
MSKNYKTTLKEIKTFVFDIDGVFTDGVVIIDSNGEQLRTANVKDGYAVQLAVKKGFNVAIISGGTNEAVLRRFAGLGVTDVFLGSSDKVAVLEKYLQQKGIEMSKVLYMGDDIPDFKVMKMVGLPVCPNDAAPEIREISSYISIHGGGKGCVRDVLEQAMKVQGLWFDDDSHHW